MVVGCFLLSGCIGITVQGKLDQIESLPDNMSRLHHKPAVHLDLWGGPDEFTRAAIRVTEQSGLFRSLTFDPAETKDVEYTIRMNLSKKEEVYLTFGLAMFACVTPYGVPIPIGRTDFSLIASVVDRAGSIIRSDYVAESLTYWCGWLLIPLAPITLDRRFEERLKNRVYENLVKAFYRTILDDESLFTRP